MPKSVIQATVSIVVLLLVLVGGAIGYIWYTGQQEVEIAEPAVPQTTKRAPAGSGPIAPDPNNPVGVSLQMLTSPVDPGSNVSLTAKTTPTADCEIKVEYDKVPSTDSGLVPKKADEYGIVSWTWTVEESVPRGEWPVRVSCKFGEKWGVGGGDLVVGVPEAADGEEGGATQ
ncbi:hypothetical protein JNJ66_06490 [Candidatus Saccharibacteria bacterium]|nr:hypothetical protein [Candidatus Saccharibacteria bacterium]